MLKDIKTLLKAAMQAIVWTTVVIIITTALFGYFGKPEVATNLNWYTSVVGGSYIFYTLFKIVINWFK